MKFLLRSRWLSLVLPGQVSIGLEGANGFDGLQVAFNDHNFPVSGTTIGFSASCGTAGENDCDAADIARAVGACSAYSAAILLGNVAQQDADFCQSDCFGNAYNLNEDCVTNPRANIDPATKQQIQQILPANIMAQCPPPDSGTFEGGGGGH